MKFLPSSQLVHLKVMIFVYCCCHCCCCCWLWVIDARERIYAGPGCGRAHAGRRSACAKGNTLSIGYGCQGRGGEGEGRQQPKQRPVIY